MAIDIKATLEDIARMQTATGNSPRPGSVELSQCIIQHGDENYYDISSLVHEIHFFEDIEQLGVSGWIQIKDNINLIRNGLILGEELLWLRFETAGATDSGHPEFAVDYSSRTPLYIHKIEEIVSPITNQGTTSQLWLEYRLHFCSTEIITNDRVRLSKAYQGRISDIVLDVMKKELGVIKKPITVTQTEDIHHFISPNLRPLDFILSIVDKARIQDFQPVVGPQLAAADSLFRGDFLHDVVFFETAHRPVATDGGWFLIPLQRSAFADLIFTLNNAATTTGAEDSEVVADIRGYPAAMMRSLSYEFITTGDKWSTISDGSWAGSEIQHNDFYKSFDVFKSDYLKHLNENKYSHASKTPVFWPPDPSWRTISEWPDSKLSFKSGSSKYFSNINTSTRLAAYPWTGESRDHKLLQELQVNHMLNYERIRCEMYGISGLQVGKMVEAVFPSIGRGSGSEYETGIAGSVDVYGEDRNNNTWMITKVGHHLMFRGSDTTYTSTMELSNTMRNTKKELPVYGSLSGAAPGRSNAGR